MASRKELAIEVSSVLNSAVESGRGGTLSREAYEYLLEVIEKLKMRGEM